MALNIEIKAKISDTELIKNKLSQLKKEILRQKDTFINLPDSGRLKIRCINDTKSQLIYYERNENEQLMPSNFTIFTYPDKAKSRKALKNFKRNYGIIAVVKKYREYYRDGNVRIHLDSVEKLGTFVEIEVVVNNNLSEIDACWIAKDYMFNKLQISTDCIISKSYVDLLTNKYY